MGAKMEKKAGTGSSIGTKLGVYAIVLVLCAAGLFMHGAKQKADAAEQPQQEMQTPAGMAAGQQDAGQQPAMGGAGDQQAQLPLPTANSVALGITKGGPALLEFTSPDCNICATMRPIIEKLKKEFTGKVEFVEVPITDAKNSKLADTYKVDGLPSFFVVDATGKALYRFEGQVPEDMVRQIIAHIATGQQQPMGM